MKKIFLFLFLLLTISIHSQNFQGWNKRQSIIINSSLVEGVSPLVNFPVLITLDHINDEVIDGGTYSALDGGGDIRFSSDAAGDNQLAIEIVAFVTSSIPANRKCQIWVKIPSLSPTTDTTIYLWYNKIGETQPLATDPYGNQAVWSNNYVSVWHMEEDPSTTAPQILDSGTASNNGVTGGNMQSSDLVLSKIGNGLALNGTDQFVNVGNDASLNLTSNLTISGWFNPNIYEDMYLFAKRNETVAQGYNILLLYPNDFGVYDTTAYWNSDATWEYTTNQWNYVVVKFNTSGTGYSGFLNGIFGSEKTIPAFPDGLAQNLYLGARSNGTGLPFSGSIDEFRVSNTVRSDEWIKTEYNNQINPSLFATAGTSVSDIEKPIPSTLSATSKTDNSVDLNWTAATDNIAVTGYKVYKEGVLETTLGNVLSYQVIGLTASTAYNFTVTALDAAGNESIASNTLAITTDATSGGGTGGYWTLNNQDVYYNTGNVGIGTNIPDSKLTVKGSIHSEEVKVDLSVPAPDYVFELSYNLTSLEKLQEYIITHGHLPNIPSAKDMETHGIELGIMNMKLLEKIEELTLYILMNESRIKVLEENIKKE